MPSITVQIPSAYHSHAGQADVERLEHDVAVLKEQVKDLQHGGVEAVADNQVTDEIVCESCDGQTTRFTLDYPAYIQTVVIECDGIDMTLGRDYNFVRDPVSGELSNQEFEFTEAPYDETTVTASYLRVSLE